MSSPSTVVIPAIVASARAIRASRIAAEVMERAASGARGSGRLALSRRTAIARLRARWRAQLARLIASWSPRPATSTGGGATEVLVTVAPGATLGLSPAPSRGRSPGGGSRIAVERGRAWITQTGDRRDHVLERGEVLRLAARGRVVVQNLGDEPLVLRCVHLV
ncbi:MAG TPA: DUF2917 domain-containing protein [Planctomycetota bacterium]|nr:DUF2917 domain-containing protein [Planctomycetota bacterium]